MAQKKYEIQIDSTCCEQTPNRNKKCIFYNIIPVWEFWDNIVEKKVHICKRHHCEIEKARKICSLKQVVIIDD